MAKYSFQVATQTFSANADGALTTGTFMSLTPGSATQIVNVIEIYMGGQSSSSTLNFMLFARSTTLATGAAAALTGANSAGPLHGATAALALPVAAAVSYATTQPTRGSSAALARLNLTFNGFGGIVRWVAAPGEEWTMVGTAVNVSESHLSAFTGSGGGLIGAHIVYEPF
jgi:hypothetical protein